MLQFDREIFITFRLEYFEVTVQKKVIFFIRFLSLLSLFSYVRLPQFYAAFIV